MVLSDLRLDGELSADAPVKNTGTLVDALVATTVMMWMLPTVGWKIVAEQARRHGFEVSTKHQLTTAFADGFGAAAPQLIRDDRGGWVFNVLDLWVAAVDWRTRHVEGDPFEPWPRRTEIGKFVELLSRAMRVRRECDGSTQKRLLADLRDRRVVMDVPATMQKRILHLLHRDRVDEVALWFAAADRARVARHRVHAIILDEVDQIVALRRVTPGTAAVWTLPGGDVDPTDADRVAALRRYLPEELGSEVVVGARLNLFSERTPDGVVVHHAFPVRAFGRDQPRRVRDSGGDDERTEMDRIPMTSLESYDVYPALLRDLVAQNTAAIRDEVRALPRHETGLSSAVPT